MEEKKRQHIMKRIIVLLLTCSIGITSNGQDMFDQSVQALKEYNNIAYDYISSFLYNPYNHENTEKVYEELYSMEKGYTDLLKNKAEVLYRYNNYKAHQYYENIETMLAMIKSFNDYIGSIVGYIRPGVDAPEYEIIIKPILEEFGWKCSPLSISSNNIQLLEYSYGNFKMLIARNTLPAPNYEMRIHNDINFSCYAYFPQLKETNVFVTGTLRGGKYRLIAYKDNQNRHYYTIKRCVTKRLYNTGVLDERLIMWSYPK